MIDEGVIKYRQHWDKRPTLVEVPQLDKLIHWRNVSHARAWVGFDEKHQVGYGNVSIRLPEGGFLISGSQTGHIAEATAAHHAQVLRYDIAANELWCVGPTKASSEALTHAAIYECDDAIQGIIHLHHKPGWEHGLQHLPCTPESVPYGTPAMAEAVRKLVRSTSGLLTMAGHEDGLFAYGPSLPDAAAILEAFLLELTP